MNERRQLAAAKVIVLAGRALMEKFFEFLELPAKALAVAGATRVAREGATRVAWRFDTRVS
jgi:electron transfer flavoprotein alpha subunit